MTAHRILNTTLALAAIVGLYAITQHLDTIDAWSQSASVNDARMAAIKERRQQMARAEFCLKSQGPATYPVEQEDGSFRCQTKRGKDAGPVLVAAQ